MLDYLVRFWKYVSVIWFQLHSAMNQVGRGLINAETRILKVFLTVSIMMQLFQYPFDPFIEKSWIITCITCESYTSNPMSNARLLIWWEHTTEGAFFFGFTDYKPLLKIHATTRHMPLSFISHSLFDAALSSHKPPCPSSLSFFFSITELCTTYQHMFDKSLTVTRHIDLTAVSGRELGGEEMVGSYFNNYFICGVLQQITVFTRTGFIRLGELRTLLHSS